MLLAEFTSTSWIHSVAFSPSGNQLAWSNRCSEISLINKTNGDAAQPLVVQHKFLPFTSLLWVDETSFLGIGHEYSPILFEVVNGKPEYRKTIGAPAGEKENSQSSAFKMFRDINRTNTSHQSNGVQSNSLHQNAVKYVCSFNSTMFILVFQDYENLCYKSKRTCQILNQRTRWMSRNLGP
jgi:actin related protein 2/3 complex subunit 1A/1B